MRAGPRIRIHGLIESSTANGPGTRAVVWLQGCSLNCPGCWNDRAQDPAGGRVTSIHKLARRIVALGRSGRIAGLTISGGEPMEQAPALALLLESLRRALPALSIGMFSGYTESELNSGNYRGEGRLSAKQSDWRRVRAILDFAVLGRYNRLQPVSLPLVTSRNQRLRLFSPSHTVADFPQQTVEVTIDAQGLTQITGFPVRGNAVAP